MLAKKIECNGSAEALIYTRLQFHKVEMTIV